jgi:hypothetical protein
MIIDILFFSETKPTKTQTKDGFRFRKKREARLSVLSTQRVSLHRRRRREARRRRRRRRRGEKRREEKRRERKGRTGYPPSLSRAEKEEEVDRREGGGEFSSRRRSVDQRRNLCEDRALFEGELKLEQDINGSQHVEEREEAVVHGWTEELFQQQHDDNDDSTRRRRSGTFVSTRGRKYCQRRKFSRRERSIVFDGILLELK